MEHFTLYQSALLALCVLVAVVLVHMAMMQVNKVFTMTHTGIFTSVAVGTVIGVFAAKYLVK